MSEGKLKGKDYDRELTTLYVELVKLQQWVLKEGLKACVVLRGVTVPARVARSRRSPNGSARACFVSWHCQRPPSARNPDVHSALHPAPTGRWRGRDL